MNPPSDFKELVDILLGVINGSIVPLLIAIALAFFIWGIYKYIFIVGGYEGISKGRDTFFWGIVVLFVAVSVWGFVNILVNTFFPGLI